VREIVQQLDYTINLNWILYSLDQGKWDPISSVISCKQDKVIV